MKVLFVCHRWPYPPKRGGKIRPFNIVSHLSRNHSVTVASIVRSSDEDVEGKGLSGYCDKLIKGRVGKARALLQMVLRLPTSVPSSMGYFFSRELKRRIADELERNSYDLVFVHCSSVAQYVSSFEGATKVLDFGDMDSQKWLSYRHFHRFPMSLGYWLEGAKLEREERRLAEQFDLCSCTTKLEYETLQSYGSQTKTAWFPNGVDHEFFHPSTSRIDPDLISFVGRMDYFPNQQAMLEFCNEVFPLIRRKRPAARLVIIGADPSSEIRKLARIDGVCVTGSVPDVRPYVSRSAVNVAPLRIARGTQNKILEAMAMGVPVVTSSLAAAGVDAVPGEHLLCADEPGKLADAVVRLLSNEKLRRRLAEAGRQRVVENHDWDQSMKRLDSILSDLVIGKKDARSD